jgi:hypothetical protein
VTGQEGQTYGFRVRARDQAGNVGTYPANPDTVTTVSTRPPSLAVISPLAGSRVLPGMLVVSGTTDPGVLVAVNETAAAVAADGSFQASIEAATSPLLILVTAQTPSGKVSRQTVLVGVGGRYPDVPVESPAFAAIEYLSDAGVLHGDSSGLFHPAATVTRGDYVAWLATALRWPVTVPGAARFTDVPPEHPAAGAIEAAVSRGAVGGYGNRLFRPEAPIGRAEAIKATTLAAGWPLLPAPDSPFDDAPLTHWAAPYIVTAYRHGLLLDSPGDSLRPATPLNRAEAARFLYALLGDLGRR